MTVQPNPLATRTIPFAGSINRNPFVAADVEERFTRHFAFLVDAFELESVEPDPTTATLANINNQAADLCFSQFIEASWAFHKTILPQPRQMITSQLCAG